ncbi:MAG: multidrug effflux MFS transporter [Rhodocyclales bacterium]|nr:multidrug effflux MFS transporter [Rhodocyclales bacterium]
MSPNTLIWLISGCLMLQPLSTDLYLASLPHLAGYFAVSPAAVQQTLSLFVIGFGTAQLISGPLSDRYGRRPVVLWGLGVYTLASFGCALAPSLPILVVGRFVQAIGCCTAVVVARAIIRDAYTPGEGARIIAKASSLMALAPIFGPIAGGYLQVAFGWRAAFVVLAGFCCLLAVAAIFKLKETNDSPNPQATRLRGLLGIYGQILRAPTFWAYTLPGALSYASIFVFISGSSFALIQVLGVATEYYGYCYAFGVSGYLSGTLVCRRLLTKIGLARTLSVGATGSLLSGLAFAGLVAAGIHQWWVVVLCQFLTMCAHGINFPCSQAGAVAPFPQQAGSAAGLLGFFTMMGALLAGTWVGASHDGTLRPLAVITVAMTLSLFLAARFSVRYREV